MNAGGGRREYSAGARSSDVFGRVICSAREQHFVIDGPTWNGCPGEALTPGEALLAGVAACGVELVQVIAREDGTDVGEVRVSIHGVVEPDQPVRDDLTVFNRVDMHFRVGGVDRERAQELVDRMTRRCPLYGSVAASAGEVGVEVEAG